MNWNDWIKKILGEPVSNTSQSMCDDCVSVNASMAYNSGLKAQIIRTTDGKCCEWCNSLAGVYDYADLDKNAEVFHRHNHCGCTVTYKCGKTYQDVHSKQMLSGAESAKAELRKVLGLTSNEEERAKTEKRKVVGLTSQEEEAVQAENRINNVTQELDAIIGALKTTKGRNSKKRKKQVKLALL